MWVDVSYDDALGHDPPQAATFAARRLKLEDPECVARYLKEYKKRVIHHKLFERQFALEAAITPGIPLNEGQEVQYNHDGD